MPRAILFFGRENRISEGGKRVVENLPRNWVDYGGTRVDAKSIMESAGTLYRARQNVGREHGAYLRHFVLDTRRVLHNNVQYARLESRNRM